MLLSNLPTVLQNLIYEYLPVKSFVNLVKKNNLSLPLKLYYNKILRVKPMPSAPVKRMLMEFGREKRELQQSFLTIETARHEYTDEYKKLTADFYLDF